MLKAGMIDKECDGLMKVLVTKTGNKPVKSSNIDKFIGVLWLLFSLVQNLIHLIEYY